MHRTKIARQVLTVLEAATWQGFDLPALKRLIVRGEQIARGRRSHVLGVRHLMLAAVKLGYLDGDPAPPEARAVTPEVVVPGTGQGDELRGQQ
jgi:hypothetical protein